MNELEGAILIGACVVLAIIALAMAGARLARDANEALTTPAEALDADEEETETEEADMATKKKKKPLTQRVFEAVQKHGAATTDAIARRCGVKAEAAGKALSKNKGRGLQDFTSRDGENVWRNIVKAWPQG